MAPVLQRDARVAENRSVKLDCEVFDTAGCRVLRLSRELSSSRQQFITISCSAAVAAGYGCRQGQCGPCATRLLQGRVIMQAEDGLSAEQKRAGFILPCVSKIQGSLCIDAGYVLG